VKKPWFNASPKRMTPLLLLLVLAGGCIKVDSTLDIASDGSGTWRVVYAIPLHMIQQMEMTQGVGRQLEGAGGAKAPVLVNRMQDIPYLFDEEAIRRRFKPLETQGVLLGKVQIRSSGGWRNVDLAVKFTRVDALLRQPFFDSLGAALSGAGTAACKLSVSLPEMGPPENLPDPLDPVVSAKISPFLNGMRIVSRIGVPGDIRNTTAVSSDGRRATWEWDYDKDPRALSRLARDKMVIVFDASQTRLRDFSKAALTE